MFIIINSVFSLKGFLSKWKFILFPKIKGYIKAKMYNKLLPFTPLNS